MNSKTHLTALIHTLEIAHRNFKLQWEQWEATRKKNDEPPEVTAARDDFWAALNALFDDLARHENDFLNNDEAAINYILDFCEMDIPAFRTGYAKSSYFRKLKNMTLTDTHQARLRNLAVKMCGSPYSAFEIKELTRIIIKIADEATIQKLHQMLESDNEVCRRRAQRMLNIVLHHRLDLRKNRV